MPHDTVKPEVYYIPLDGSPPDAIDWDTATYIEFKWWGGESYRPEIILTSGGYQKQLHSEIINVIMTRLRNAADMTYDGPPPHVAKIVTKASIVEETAMKLAIPILPTPPTYTIPPEDWKGFPVWKKDVPQDIYDDISIAHEYPFTELRAWCRQNGINYDA